MAGGSAAAGRLVAAGQRVRCRALVLSRDKTPVRTFMTGAYKAATHPEHGWKTAHFWGPVANWGIVGAAVYDATARGPEVISIPMTGAMCLYSALFMRFAWMVQPRNYLLLACHVFNEVAQLNQMRRALEYQSVKAKEEAAAAGAEAPVGVLEDPVKLAGGALVGAAVLGTVAVNNKIKSSLLKSGLPDSIKTVVGHPAGPFTIHFWAPTCKWLLSVSNLADLERPTDTISLAQTTALFATGVIWSRYSMIITPKNWNLFAVNVVLAASSGFHLARKVNADYIGYGIDLT